MRRSGRFFDARLVGVRINPTVAHRTIRTSEEAEIASAMCQRGKR
jgi:hypothetical protein